MSTPATPAGSSEPPHVALFGFYKYGNFGDDLMAVIFGRKLQSLGIPFRVYQLRPDIVAECGFVNADSIDDLLEGAAAVVYGGGGAFLGTKVADFEQTVSQLCAKCAKKNIPIYVFSVGGEGKPCRELADARQLLLRSAAYISFRNREDSILLDEIGRDKGAIHHDVVWQTPSCFSLQRHAPAQTTIGIDHSLLRRRHRWIIRLLMLLCRALRKPYRFVSINQSSNRKVLPGFADSIQYADGMQQFIRELLQTNLVITNRLHVGMVAMSFGIPTIELFPQRKAALLFRRLGLDHLVFGSYLSLPRLAWLLIHEARIRHLQPSRTIRELDKIIGDSENHLLDMARLVEGISPR